MAARIQSLRNGIDPIDEASRDDLVAGDVMSLISLDGATTYDWTLVFVPEGSTAVFSGDPTQITPGSFIVDVEGSYLVRLVVDSGLPGESTQYVRLRYLTEFGQLHLIAAGERRDGTGIIPVDIDAEGWANEQNANLQTLKSFIKPLVASGRLLYVDANDGTQNYADFSTVQDAIDHAVAQTPSDAEQWVVAVRPGRYVEDISFADFVHVIGWPGNPDGLSSEAVVLEGLHTSTVGASNQLLIANLHLENNADTSSPTLLKNGAGRLRLFASRVESNGLDVSQGAALQLDGGFLDAIRTYFVHNTAGGAARPAFYQPGASTAFLDSCFITGPSGALVNHVSAPVAGVFCILSNCRVSGVSGIGIGSLAERLTVEHSTVSAATDNSILVNPFTLAFAGDVALTVLFSNMDGKDIKYDTTTLAGATALDLGSVVYRDLVFPAGAPTQLARTKSKTHFYDNTVSGLVAENVQDAIDEVAAIAVIAPLTFNKNIPEIPGDSVSYRGWVPVTSELIGVRVRMMNVHTVGNYELTIQNEDTGNTVLLSNPQSLNALVDGVITPISLTGTASDLIFPALAGWNATFTSDDSGFDGTDVYIELLFNTATGSPGVTEDLATTLLIGNITGGTDIEVTPGDIVQFGDSPVAPVAPVNTGRIRYNQASGALQGSVDGGPWQDLGSGSAVVKVHKNVPPLPAATFRYEGWAPVDGAVSSIRVMMVTKHTTGAATYTATFTNEATGNTMLVGASYDMDGVVAGAVENLILTGVPADLIFSAEDKWSVEFTSTDPGFDGDGIYFEIVWGTSSASFTLPGAPDDDHTIAMAVSPGNTVNELFFAPYALTLVGVNAYCQSGALSAGGVYTLAVEDVSGAPVNLLSAATFDMETTGSLPAATLTPVPLTGVSSNLDMALGTPIRIQLVSDNVDLVASGVYIQLLFRAQ